MVEHGEIVMQVLLVIGYIVLGLFQFAAVVAGLEEWVGLHWIIAVPLSIFIAYIPLIGTVVGMFGAVTAWHWSWVQAGSLFFGPFIVVAALSIASGFLASRQ